MKKCLFIFFWSFALVYAGNNFPSYRECKKLTTSFSLQGIINDQNSPPFACHFGRFHVKVMASYGLYKYLSLLGSGLLINSMTLSFDVHTNPLLIYSVPRESPIEDGSILVMYYTFPKDNDQERNLLEYYLLEYPVDR